MQQGAVGNQADQNGEQGTGGVGQTHGQQSRREEAGGQVGAGNTDQKNGQGVVEEGQARPADGAEVAAEAELDPGEEADSPGGIARRSVSRYHPA